MIIPRIRAREASILIVAAVMFAVGEIDWAEKLWSLDALEQRNKGNSSPRALYNLYHGDFDMVAALMPVFSLFRLRL